MHRSIQIFVPRPRADIQLVCFPYAAGGASIFRTWAQELPDSIEVLAIQMPGRENRFRERALSSYEEVMTEILPELRAALRTNYVTFGHSFGAILSYALICDAPRFELPLPLMMLFSGAGAPLVPPTTKPALDRSTLIADMKKMGGTPQEILDDPRFVDAFLPTLRADLEILHLTRLRPSQPLAVPFSTFAGEWDQSVPPQNVRKWEALSTKSTAHHVFEGGHFFLNEVRHQVLNTIATKLTDRLVVQKKDTAGELS